MFKLDCNSNNNNTNNNTDQIDKDLADVQTTFGYEPHEIKYENRAITLYDLGGSARVRDIWRHYMAESYGFIYVIDSSNRNRINEARLTLQALIENEKVHRKPILMLEEFNSTILKFSHDANV